MRLEPSADGAEAAMATAALDDALGRRQLADLPPEVRQLWVRSAERLGDELSDATTLALSAVARRPGWAHHSLLLGQVVYAAQSRPAKGAAADQRQWLSPLLQAVSAAPGLEPAWTFLGGAYLERWSDLDSDARAGLSDALRRAFADPDFVARAFPSASSVLGVGSAKALLPDRMKPLRAAAETLATAGDVTGAAALLPAVNRAARKERTERLQEIRTSVRNGDIDGARSACLLWTREFAISDFDDEAGRRQTAELLELWPGGVAGAWRTDPRASLVRFFLAKRENDVSGTVLLRTIDSLTDVPELVRARVLLLADDEAGAVELARSSPASKTLEWSPFFVQLARARLERGDAIGARQALAHVPPSARGGCDVLLARHDVAVALGDEAETATTEELLQWVGTATYGSDAWSAEGSISLCLLPDSAGRRTLRVEIQASAPTVLVCGWNGGSFPPLLVGAGHRTVRVPLPGGSGRQTLSVQAAWGGPIRPGSLTLDRSVRAR